MIVFVFWQFEFMSQHLVFANCIPLVLKFFNQNILSYVTAKNRLDPKRFAKCKDYLKGKLIYVNVLFPDKTINQSYKISIKETTIKLHVYDWCVF